MGSSKEVSSRAGVERRRDTWDIYVGNLDEDVTELQIVKYLKDGVWMGKCVFCYHQEYKVQGVQE